MGQGYIKLYRSINQHDLLEYDNNCYIVFTKLLTRCDRMTGSYRTGRNRMAAHCNMKPSTLRDALNRLEAATMIRQQADSKATTIFICNWWKFQQDDDSSTTAARQQTDTKQEERRRRRSNKEINKEKSLDKVSGAYDELSTFWHERGGRKLSTSAASRKAVKNLISEHTVDEVKYAILGAIYFQGKQYKPQVMSFTSLYEKWDNLIGHMQSEKGNHESNRFE